MLLVGLCTMPAAKREPLLVHATQRPGCACSILSPQYTYDAIDSILQASIELDSPAASYTRSIYQRHHLPLINCSGRSALLQHKPTQPRCQLQASSANTWCCCRVGGSVAPVVAKGLKGMYPPDCSPPHCCCVTAGVCVLLHASRGNASSNFDFSGRQ